MYLYIADHHRESGVTVRSTTKNWSGNLVFVANCVYKKS
jgi:hypothetical protein